MAFSNLSVKPEENIWPPQVAVAYHSKLVTRLHLCFILHIFWFIQQFIIKMAIIVWQFYFSMSSPMSSTVKMIIKCGHHLCLNWVEVFGKLDKPLIVVGVFWTAPAIVYYYDQTYAKIVSSRRNYLDSWS